MMKNWWILGLLLIAIGGLAQTENRDLNEKLAKVHPYAFYLLAGGDYFLADTEEGTVAVNLDKFTKAPNEAAGAKVFKQDEWTGFTSGDTMFKYKIFQRLENPDYFVAACFYTGGGSTTFTKYLLIRVITRHYYAEGAIKNIRVATCEGSLGLIEPPFSEIIKLNQLVAKKQLGDK